MCAFRGLDQSDRASDVGKWDETIIAAPPIPVVTPDSGTTSSIVPGSVQTSVFTVTNTSTSIAAYDFTAACLGTAVPRGCTITPTSATLAGSGNTTVQVQWTAGGAGTTGRITPRAVSRDGAN